jgi:hypothetical protein
MNSFIQQGFFPAFIFFSFYAKGFASFYYKNYAYERLKYIFVRN